MRPRTQQQLQPIHSNDGTARLSSARWLLRQRIEHCTITIERNFVAAHTFLFFYRQDAAKRQTAGIKFTHRPKIRFFAQQRRLIAPIHVKLGRADGHLGPLGCAKFYINHHSGVAMRPQNIKNFHCFGKESPRRGESLD